jgi:hypothetical protein
MCYEPAMQPPKQEQQQEQQQQKRSARQHTCVLILSNEPKSIAQSLASRADANRGLFFFLSCFLSTFVFTRFTSAA